MKTEQGPKIIYSVLSVSVKTGVQTHWEPGLLLSPEARREKRRPQRSGRVNSGKNGDSNWPGIFSGPMSTNKYTVLTLLQVLQCSVLLLPELLGQKWIL